jgi:hypothetical protein
MSSADDKSGNYRMTDSSSSSVTARSGKLVFGSACLGGPISLSTAGAPWWAVFTLSAFLSILALAAVCLQTVFPQNSRDRVAWWREFWRRYMRTRSVVSDHQLSNSASSSHNAPRSADSG